MLKHRKINLLDIVRPFYAVGDATGVGETPWGRIGIRICADNAPGALTIGHCLGRMGARALLSPCAWAVEAGDQGPYGDMWKSSFTELARLYEMPVVGVSNVGWIEGGPWQGRKCIGNSIAVSADAEVIAEGPFGVDAVDLPMVELALPPAPAVGTDWADGLHEKGHQPA